MDTERLRDLAPHYLVMVVLSLVGLATVQAAFGRQHLLVELVVVLGIFLAYGYVVTSLGVGPDAWEAE